MSEYAFLEIEKKWQKIWEEEHTYQASINTSKPKYYALDMFPYPSGAGLHVGHPLGYIASDIVSRYKRIKGFNVLHPMGFDSFGLPAEQYAVQTGQHPAITTDTNIKRYKEQLNKLGFSFDWSREIRTSNPDYYKWTQWIFLQLFDSWYNKSSDKAEPIAELVATFEKEGNANINACCDDSTTVFSAAEWLNKSVKEQQDILLQYRLTYLADLMVNWCPALGTVLANEEVKDGVSERGGHPVERKKMRQWVMRITAYAERMLQGLDNIDWPEPMKEMQRNWIGKSYGAALRFEVVKKTTATDAPDFLTVFTTRVDTTFGVTYVSIAPEHEWIPSLTAATHKAEVEDYVLQAKNRSERDRMTDVKTVSGQFTGTYVINPFTNKEVPLYIADYVLAGYGTGVVMAVPSSDERDFRFATHFGLPIVAVQEGAHTDISQENFDPKAGTMINSEFLNGLTVAEAIQQAIVFVEEKGFGKGKLNYRIRDAIFSRQRYWGEPIPMRFEDGIAVPLKVEELPLLLPNIDKYQPTETGEPPLGRAADFASKNYELNTMPGWAGSSWYFLRYMDAKNETEFVSKEAEKYWNQVDLYIGGSEHATGHLLYSRFWNQFLYDLGLVSHTEPFKKLINQGMIQGRSSFVYRINGTNKYVSSNLKKQYDTQEIHVDVSFVENDVLEIETFKQWRAENHNAEFILEDGKYICGSEVEKMSKSKYNVVNPDEMVDKYGADTLRMYEMFLGPLEQFKPWNTSGIDGVYRFLRKLWRLVYDESGKLLLTDAEPSKEALKIVHKTLKKVEEDIEKFSFNTSVSSFMICVNTLQELKCHSKVVLQDLLIALSPYAPFITEELWHTALGHNTSISLATFPAFNEAYLVESEFEYPISINGKMRAKIMLPLSLSKEEIEQKILSEEGVQKWLEGKAPKKVIVVVGKIVNLVV